MNIRKTIYMSFIILCLSVGIANITKAALNQERICGESNYIYSTIQKNSQVVDKTNSKAGLMDFSNNFRPQFHDFVEKYSKKYSQDFKFINYNGLMRMNTKDGIKYAQTYQVKLNYIDFKSLINYVTSGKVKDIEIISFMKQIMLSCIELSESGDKEQQKEKIENIFTEMALNPQKSMKKIKVFLDAMDSLKIIGSKGIDITYNICDGYIISENGVADIKIDTHKIIDVIDKLNSNEISNIDDIKNILALNYNVQEHDSSNNFDLIKLECNSFRKLKENKEHW